MYDLYAPWVPHPQSRMCAHPHWMVPADTFLQKGVPLKDLLIVIGCKDAIWTFIPVLVPANCFTHRCSTIPKSDLPFTHAC